jgi:hypothetical protein
MRERKTMSQKFSTYGYEFLGVQDHGKVDGACFNCGLGIRYFAIFKNVESGELVHIGQTCLVNSTPAQKRAFSQVEKEARIARKIEKFLTSDPIGKRLAEYCANNEESEDKESSNWMLFLKKRHLEGCGSFNDAEYKLVELHLANVGA